MNSATMLNAHPPSALPIDVRLMNSTATLLFALIVFGLAALLLSWAARLPAFAIRSIRVEGDVTRNSVSTIRANALPKLAGTFLTMDLQQARNAFESVPWVRQAVVRREWPNRLAVQLEEFRPVAQWGQGDDASKLVSAQGEVFDANLGDVEDDHLPTLQGPDGSAPQMLTMLRRLAPVFKRLDADIDALTLSARGSWRVELDSGAEVELGRGSDDEVLARTERFAATLTQVSSRYRRPLEYADLRHNDGYALRLKGITTGTVTPPAAAAKTSKR
jgi:cell division protein FtsQ